MDPAAWWWWHGTPALSRAPSPVRPPGKAAGHMPPSRHIEVLSLRGWGLCPKWWGLLQVMPGRSSGRCQAQLGVRGHLGPFQVTS